MIVVSHQQARDEVRAPCSRRGAAGGRAAGGWSRRRRRPTRAARATRPRRSPPCRRARRRGRRSPRTAASATQGRAERGAPRPPPIVKSGASVPPDVPLPSEIAHETNFSAQRSARALRPARRSAENRVDVVVADAERARQRSSRRRRPRRRRSPATTSSGSGASRTRLRRVDGARHARPTTTPTSAPRAT